MAGPEEWFKSLTPVAKAWLSIAVITTVGAQFGFINLAYLYFDPMLIYKKFQVFHHVIIITYPCTAHHHQIWRFVTTFFYFGKLGFGFLIQMFILTRYTQMLENDHFPGPSGLAEMVFLLIFGGSGLILLNWIVFGGSIPFLASALSFVLLYVWSRKSPYIDVTFWGFQFKAWHLPFVLLLFTFIMGNSPVLDIFGILVGHLYHFLMDIVPRVYNKNLIACPQVLYNIFDKTEARRNNWRGAAAHRLN